MKSTAKKGKKPKCEVRGCKQLPKTGGLCRLHYLAKWKENQAEKKVRAERRLNAYVDRLAQRYPDDYLEKIKEGLENEETFKKAIQELEIDQEDTKETESEFIEKFSRGIKGED